MSVTSGTQSIGASMAEARSVAATEMQNLSVGHKVRTETSAPTHINLAPTHMRAHNMLVFLAVLI